MFKIPPTGPKIKYTPGWVDFDPDYLLVFMRQTLQGVHDNGGDINIHYSLPDGKDASFVFNGDPYKGMPLAQIDMALTWELEQFSARMGWQ